MNRNDYEYYKETTPAGMDEMKANRLPGFLYENTETNYVIKEYYRLESGENVIFYSVSHETNYLSITLNVATICRRVELSEVNFDIPKDCLVEIAGIIGVAHDLGRDIVLSGIPKAEYHRIFCGKWN